MKSIKLTSTLFLLFWTIAVQAITSPGYVINGNFKGLPEGSVIELIPAGTHNAEKVLASNVLKAGKFIFKGRVAGPRLFRITVKGYYSDCLVMVSNNQISVSGNASLTESGGSKFLKLTNMKVLGSPVHQEYLKKVAYREQLNDEHVAYNKRGEAIMKQIDEARDAKDSVKYKALLQTAAYKQFESEEKAFFTNVEKRSFDLINAHKDSWWGPFLMLNAYSYFTPAQQPLFNSFSKSAKESFYGEQVHEELFPKGFLGQSAPLVDAKTSDHTKADLKAIIKGNKYTLVDFWASWCAPCRKALPKVKALYEEMKGKGFQVVSISIDKKEADWLKAEDEEQLKWPSFLDNGATADAWKIKTIPALFLLDENGKVIAENLTLEEVKAKIQ